MTGAARLALIALGLAVGTLALALWYDADRNDLSGADILLGAVALALVITGAVATPGSSTTGRRRH